MACRAKVPSERALALVGEQPGDREDLVGKPFVGPAGGVLDRALEAADIDRADVFVTNAVKHFKHAPRGKRRIHQKPNVGEVEVCRWWLANELRLASPRLTVALGATAARSVMGYAGAIASIRGAVKTTREGGLALATVHPSYLLRLPDETEKRREFAAFVADLKTAKNAAALSP